MIMAGRGQRLIKSVSEKPGISKAHPESESVDLALVINKINEIKPNNVNPSLVLHLRRLFKQLFTSKEAMREALSDLHDKALQDDEFGEKLVVALEQVLNFEIDGVLLRGELLSFIQNDFKLKETVSQSDPKKFVNSVLLLGNVFQKVRVCGSPIAVLGVALLEYFDLLIKGGEEQLKTLTKQIFLNGSKLLGINKYELLEHNLRNTLVTKQLDCPSKCWILLAIDFMSNGLKPLKGPLREFYISNLGSEFKKLEALIEIPEKPTINEPTSLNKQLSSSENTKPDLTEKFSDLNVKSGGARKEKAFSPPGRGNKKENWKFNGGGKGNSEHDDRFEKEENFYGVQKPRELKPESQKKKFNDAEFSKKEIDSVKTDSGNKMESETENKLGTPQD